MTEVLMAAKHPGTCNVCGEKFTVDTPIAWTPGKGARHQSCTEQDNTQPATIPTDTKNFKDPNTYDWVTAKTINNCQKCGVDLKEGRDRCFDGSDTVGFRAVCRKCF